jgi:hypothetical protein
MGIVLTLQSLVVIFVLDILTTCYTVFCILNYGFCMVLTVNSDISFSFQLMFLMVKCCILFEVRTGILNFII